MRQIFFLVLLFITTGLFAQAPANYTNINGRYRWIAGMFDSTFHIPKGTTPSLRTGGSTNSGGLFYNTSDSSVYTYTGTQWIKLRGSLNSNDTTNKYVTQVYKKSGSDSIFYVKGGIHTWAFNDSTGSAGGGGGGKIYYFNGGVNMGTFGGFTMYELGDTANTGAAANFTRATTGNIANFITDPNKPGLLQIPAGVWTVDAWLSETGGGANHAQIYVKVEKWDGSIITTIATSPIEEITEGNTPNLYTWSVTIPTTTIAVTDRIIIQFYIQNTNGKTVTLYTQNGYVGEVHTTFTTGIGAINGLTAPAQYLTTGTSGTDFNISSVTATHTFNLPTASATNRGALSTTDWTTFNNKVGGSGTSGQVAYFNGTNSITSSPTFAFTPTSQLLVNNSVTASGAIARGINVTPTLTAAANNDVLVGLDIAPTFTNGAFTGVSNLALRVQNGNGLLSWNQNATTELNISNTTSGTNSQATLKATSSGGNIQLGKYSATTTAYKIISSNNGFIYNSTSDLAILADQGGSSIKMTANGATLPHLQIFSTGNVGIGQTTDAGFRLDIAGTARVQGNTTILGGSLTVNNTSIGVITGGNDVNSRPMQFQNDGTSGNWGGGYTFRSGFNGSSGVIMMRLFSNGTAASANAVGIGAYTEGALQGNNVKLAVFDRASGSGATLPNYSDGISINSAAGANYNYTNTKILGLTIGEPDTGGQVVQATTTQNYSVNIGFQRHQLVNGWGSSMIMSAKDDAGTMNEIMRVMGRNQSVGIGVTQTTNLGTKLQVGGSVTASSSLAQGVFVNNTLVAAANNDVLVGLDINPTFTNGAFTGVANAGLRSSSWLFVNSSSAGIVMGSGITFNPSGTPINGFILNPNGVYYRGSGSGFTHSFRTNSNDASGERLRLTDANVMMLNTNVLVNTTTDAGFRLDVNGTARVQGQLTITTNGASITGGITATSNGHRFGNIQVLTSGTPTSSGVGMTCNGGELDFLFYGGNAATDMFSFQKWNGGLNPITTVSRSIVRIYSGFTDGNINNLMGNQLWLSPTYNFAGTRTGIIVRGIYYNPTLTSLTNTTHRAIETETGDVVFGSTSGNVMIGTTTAGGRFTIQPTNDQVGMSISGSSLTGSNAQSLVSLSQTWNTTGNPTAFLLNITNTASGATADLMELQVGGVAQFIVGKSGTIQTTAPAGGTAKPWKLGNVAVVSPTSPDRTIEVEIDGVTYYIHAKTTNN